LDARKSWAGNYRQRFIIQWPDAKNTRRRRRHPPDRRDTVELNRVVVRNFICGKPGHCGAGMKLAVRVTPVCRNDSSGFINTICFNVPLGGAASGAGLGSLLVTVVSLLLGLTLTIG
jgi:hypothetical protein